MAAFKEILNLAYIERLGQALGALDPTSSPESFCATASEHLDALEMKARAYHIGNALYTHLPGATYPEKLDALHALEHAFQNVHGDTPDLFEYWPWTAIISTFGAEHPEASLDALATFTSRFTGEFDIRVFLELHRDETMKTLLSWTESPDEHVRRLVSEGTRPYLPWGARVSWLEQNPDEVFALLDILKDDPSEYVRRSVANNLNDYTRERPDDVLDLLETWQDNANKERAWVIKHALRSLVKKGNTRALSVLGFSPAPHIDISNFTTNTSLSLGEHLDITFDLENQSDNDQPLVVDFVIHHVKANGSLRPKVFKLRTFTLAARETKTLSKRHAFKSITTRRYYSGTHRIDIKINGEVVASREFDLAIPDR